MERSSTPLTVEVILFNPEIFGRCMDCELIWGEEKENIVLPTHLEQAVAGLPKDIAEDYINFAQWIYHLQDSYGRDVKVRIIDAISIEGVAKSSQFGINYYPAVIVNHRKLYSWQNLEEASEEIESLMREVELERERSHH